MPGVWKKTLTYLGLVEDDEFEELDEVGAAPETAEVRRFQRPQAVREVELEPEHQGIVRTIPSSRAVSMRRGTSPIDSRTGSRSS
jgi:hypothetical protein